MRRVSASLLALTFVVSLLAPIVLASPESNLPACCRRDGKHHCGMGGAAKADPHSGFAFKAAKVRCAEYPFTGAAPIVAKVAPPAAGAAVYAAVANHPAVHAQTEARQRTCFTRTSQKRGPPSLLS